MALSKVRGFIFRSDPVVFFEMTREIVSKSHHILNATISGENNLFYLQSYLCPIVLNLPALKK